ncbi:hypothetical protein F5Y07DRAFT_370525 [Xylaria sp. FL0933]|nr:hypothetical protein F5Y07DRAFT_370525 [Xylaria sp. FL0933]
MSQNKVFLTTGRSPGFGKALDQECLDAGHRVIATSRHFSSLSFSYTHEHNYLAVDVGVCSQNTISAASSLSSAAFGQIDVIVNSAGYGLCSAFEEHTDDEIQPVMDIKLHRGGAYYSCRHPHHARCQHATRRPHPANHSPGRLLRIEMGG